MSSVQIVIGAILTLLIIEYFIFFLINYLKKDFQWLITEVDDQPTFPSKVLDKFFAKSYDPILGWVRKKNTNGFDKGKNGQVKYSIDSLGSRNISAKKAEQSSSLIASFGDSYTFCRQVEDEQTWQALMSSHLKTHVLNFGVGNYGLDQALIRYNNTPLPNTVKTVIMGVVPETICRVHSYWKHYLEFGNTLAFKPRFILEEGKLRFCENIIKEKNDFRILSKHLDSVKKHDEFYLKKYRSHQFKNSYLVSFFKHPKHNVALVYHILKRKLFKTLGVDNPRVENAAFTVIMKNNIADSHKMYEEIKYCELLKSLIIQFKKDADRQGHEPLLVIMPQLTDLKSFKNDRIPYEEFYNNLKKEIDVLDLTKSLLNENFSECYIDDQYGGHFSEKGNAFVSDKIIEHLKS